MVVAKVAYRHVMAGAGAVLPRRDDGDARIAREVLEGGGHIVKWVPEAGE